jgi:hypothetical protein
MNTPVEDGHKSLVRAWVPLRIPKCAEPQVVVHGPFRGVAT